MRLKRTIFAIHPMIRNTLLLFPLLAVLLVYFLQEGIIINSLKIGNFKVEKLYLKLDNKLILTIESLTIPKSNTQEQLKDIDSMIKKLKKVLTYFEYIELNRVIFTNDRYRVIYADDTIYIDSNTYEIAGMISPQIGGVVVELPLLYIKQYNLRLSGKITYGYENKKFTFQGNYKIVNVEGTLRVQLQNKKLSFLVDSKEAKSITEVLDMFPILPKVRVWLDQKIKAKRYQVLSLRGEGDIRGKQFVLDFDTLYAKAKLVDATVIFHPKLSPLLSKQVHLELHGRRLDFIPEDPTYLGRSIAGSHGALLHLGKKGKLELLLKLKLHTQYDKEIIKLLKTYKLKIPLQQQKGKIRTEIKLDIAFKKDKRKKYKVKVEGRAFVSKGEISIAGTPLKTEGGEVTFTSHRVGLWDVELHDSWYRGKVNGFIDLHTKKGKFKVDLKQLTLGDKKSTALVIKNKKKLPVQMSYEKGIQFDIPAYNTHITGGKNKDIKIITNAIAPLLPVIKGLPIPITGGKLSVTIKKKGKYLFNGKALWKKSYLYQKNSPLTILPFSGSYQGENLTLELLNNKVTYRSKTDLISLKNINIDVKKLMSGDDKGGALSKKLDVKAQNSILRYGKYILLTNQFSLKIRGKNTTFIATKDGDRVRVDKNGNSLVVHANKIRDKMLKALLNFEGLYGGRYSLDMLGQIDGELKGTITIDGGAIKSFKAYNDLIALFNTIPALMSLSDPGFSSKGFVMRDGKIVFRILSDRVVFDSIYLNGKSSTIAGKGFVELATSRLNIDLAIRTAREMGKVLGNLPLVGYILFGEDKSMTTGVKIIGTLDHPQAKTYPIQEALLYPLELIKRTITSPAHIINK